MEWSQHTCTFQLIAALALESGTNQIALLSAECAHQPSLFRYNCSGDIDTAALGDEQNLRICFSLVCTFFSWLVANPSSYHLRSRHLHTLHCARACGELSVVMISKHHSRIGAGLEISQCAVISFTEAAAAFEKPYVTEVSARRPPHTSNNITDGTEVWLSCDGLSVPAYCLREIEGLSLWIPCVTLVTLVPRRSTSWKPSLIHTQETMQLEYHTERSVKSQSAP